MKAPSMAETGCMTSDQTQPQYVAKLEPHFSGLAGLVCMAHTHQVIWPGAPGV
jgi:hypothetical protein